MRLPDILKNLKTTNIHELKNIDVKQFKSFIWGNPRNIIFTFMILATAFISWKLYSQNIRQSTLLMETIPALNKKLDIIEKQNSLKNDITAFVKKSPLELPPEKMINFITEIAGKLNIQITSLSPAKITQNTDVNSTSIEFEIKSDDYMSLVLFIKEIEGSAYSLKIQHWSGRLEEGMLKTKTGNGSNTFIAKIELASIKINE